MANVRVDSVTKHGNTVTLKGTGLPGATVSVYDGAIKLGETTVDANGNWTLEITPGNAMQVTAKGSDRGVTVNLNTGTETDYATGDTLPSATIID